MAGTKKIPSMPAHQVCPLCATDELDYTKLGDGLWQLTCPDCLSPDGSGPWTWTCDTTVVVTVPDGYMAEIGLFDDLPLCLTAGESWVEHGVVEDRYRRLRPRTYAELLDRYSHTSLGPTKYSASAFIATALGLLSRQGEIVLLGGQTATGYWSYNGDVGYWALPPAPPTEVVLTWAEYAPTVGIDPETWPIPLS